MENCPMTLDIERKFGDELHVLFITKILYIVVLSMVFSFVAWMMRKLPRHLKKLTQGFVVLTSQVLNFIFKLNGWVITSPLWSRTVWSMQKDAQHVNSMQTSFINLKNLYILLWLHGHLMLGD